MAEGKAGQTITYRENIMLSEETMDLFDTFLKRGIYKELHQRKMLSDGQIACLLKSEDKVNMVR